MIAWVLILLSYNGYPYIGGPAAAFFTKADCEVARAVIQKENGYVRSVCIQGYAP